MSNRYVIKNGFLSRGNSQITGSLIGTTDIEAKGSIIGNEMKMVSVSGSNSKLHFTGSAYSSIHLEVLESGSVSFESQGSGSLFSIVDTMSGSIMSVNDISGLPILEVFSNDKVVAGAFNKNTFIVNDNSVTLGSSDTSGSTDVRGNMRVTGSINVSSDIIATTISGSFSGSFAGNGNNLTFTTSTQIFSGSFSGSFSGVSVSTNFSQSLFVSPSGNDGTAVVGDIHKPWQTILAATASANIGDTIIVMPGTYDENYNVIKDVVNYFFYPGSKIYPTAAVEAPIGGGSSYNLNHYQYQYPINIRGALDVEIPVGSGTVGSVNLTAPGGYAEFGTVTTKHLSGKAYYGSISINQNDTLDDAGILHVVGNVEEKSNGTTGLNAGVALGTGRIRYEGNINVTAGSTASGKSGARGIYVIPDFTEALVYADVYTTSSDCIHNESREYGSMTFHGRLECNDISNYYAINQADGYQGAARYDGKFIGAIRLNGGGLVGGGTTISGYQYCVNSPSSLGAIQIHDGYHTIDLKIQAQEDIFYYDSTARTDTSYTIFTGHCMITGNQTGRIFNIDGGTFVWNGLNGDYNIRSTTNTVSAGKLIINSPLDHYGSSFPNNEHVFDLQGGILEINNRISYFQTTTGSGFINMTGGYLKLNSAEFVQDSGTGSLAYTIDLNGGTHSGSFLNNSFTNLTLSGSGTFTNEAPAGTGNLYYFEGLQ